MLADLKRLGWWVIVILTLFFTVMPAQAGISHHTYVPLPRLDRGIYLRGIQMDPAVKPREVAVAGDASLRWHDIFSVIINDYSNYYSIQGLKLPLTGLAIGGITANAEFDFMFRDLWQNKLRSHTTNDIADVIDDYSQFTHWYYSIPVYALSLFVPIHAIQHWGNISLRMLALGAPQQAVLTSLLGSSRPPVGKPQWHPFEYHRGVSGHAFYGAVPLLALAAIQENSYLKWSCYTLSILPGLARINNDKHYFTQAFLGWWLAYSALNAISPAKTTVYAMPLKNGIFLAGRIHF